MPKISRGGGPSSVDARPGDIIEDGNGRPSALHPDEQGALTLQGDRDDSQWLDREDGEDVSPGNSSSRSSKKQPSSDATRSDDRRQPARTTASRSNQDAKPDNSTAGSTGGSGRDSRGVTSK